ncbi:MAG: Fe-S cluster assembly protein IscX [Phycisphaerae bacterium]|nr:Fe-S cluster assembly protein IscX [Phycisphaerae bacterium]
MGTLRWSDADEIAFLLYEAHPQIDPLEVRFTDLHRYVTQLPDFAGDPAASTERALEAIQMAWLAYYKETR